jgi:hypothetical protein
MATSVAYLLLVVTACGAGIAWWKPYAWLEVAVYIFFLSLFVLLTTAGNFSAWQVLVTLLLSVIPMSYMYLYFRVAPEMKMVTLDWSAKKLRNLLGRAITLISPSKIKNFSSEHSLFLLSLWRTSNSIVGESFQFWYQPRSIVRKRREHWTNPAPTYQVLLWCFALIAVCLKLYTSAFGSIYDGLWGNGNNATIQYEVVTSDSPPVSIVDWDLRLGFSGFGFTFPELEEKTRDTPQYAIFSYGYASVLLDNVIPNWLGKKSFQLFLVVFYSSILALCVHIVAKAFRSEGTFVDVFRVISLQFSYAYIGLFLSVVLSVVVFSNTFQIVSPSPLFGLGLSMLFLIPFIIRSYFSILAEFYAISLKRMSLIVFCAVLLSGAILPIVLIPGTYIVFRYKSEMELLFEVICLVFPCA